MKHGVKPDVWGQISPEIARDHSVIPIGIAGPRLELLYGGTVPLSESARSELSATIEFLLGRPVNLNTLAECPDKKEWFEEMFDRHYNTERSSRMTEPVSANLLDELFATQ